jgi:hypothetical protein
MDGTARPALRRWNTARVPPGAAIAGSFSGVVDADVTPKHLPGRDEREGLILTGSDTLVPEPLRSR